MEKSISSEFSEADSTSRGSSGSGGDESSEEEDDDAGSDSTATIFLA